MELNKQPTTEVEYWEVIEELGGYIWRLNHDLADGRIKDKDGKIAKSIGEMNNLLERLIIEIGKKFGVIHPKDCPKVRLGQQAPPPWEGKIYYWDWYKKMKEICYRKEYKNIICSACPLSTGLDRMIALGGVIPCGVFRGSIYNLSMPYECGMLGRHNWSREELYKEITNQGGIKSLKKFKRKEKRLKDKFTKKKQQ